MYLIINTNNQVFSRITNQGLLGSEIWASKIDLDRMVPIQISIFPDESTALTTIHNILNFREEFNDSRSRFELLRIIPFNEYFKEN